MSLDSSLSKYNAVPSWRELESLLEEIAALAGSGGPSASFHAALLDRSVRALQGVGGAVWTRNAQGLLHLEQQINLGATRLPESRQDQVRHAYLLDEAMRSGVARCVAPHSGAVAPEEGANPSPLWLVLAPVMIDDTAAGLLEVFQAPDVSSEALRANLQLLTEIAGLAADHYRHRQLHDLRAEQAEWRRFDRFVREAFGRLDVQTAAAAVVHEARVALECDRVSVALVRYGRCRLQAISGVDWFDRRANEVRRLEHLAQAVWAADLTVWTGTTQQESSAPQIEDLLQTHVDESACRTWGAIPLRLRAAELASSGQDSIREAPALGVLLIEHYSARLDEEARQRAERLAPYAAAALHPALEIDRIPLAATWRAVGAIDWLRRTPKWGLGLFIVLVCVAALIFVPADFAVEASGQLQPKTRRHVFAPSEGIVTELTARHGKEVRRDEVLAVLRDPELEFEFRRLEGEIQTAQKRLAAVEALRLEDASRRNEADIRPRRWTAEKEEIEETLAGLRAQLEILQRRQAALTIRSPLDGSVITWDVERRLASRPVARGQVLLTVADLQGPWVIELETPDRQMGHIVAAQRRQRGPLAVSFFLETEPAVVHRGEVVEVSLTVDPDANDRAHAHLVVAVEEESLRDPRPGTVVKARIACGRRSLGYVWLHEVWEAVQRSLWF